MKAQSTPLLALGLAAPPATWFLAQQGSGDLTYFACQAAGPPLGLLLGGLGLVACAAAAMVSRRRLKAGAGFTDQVVLGVAAIFALANIFTLAAILLVPSCAR